MTARHDASGFDLGRVKHCGAYTPGHEVHYIQARLSNRAGPGTGATVTDVARDGTITFADGTTKWNHEPKRLRRAIERTDGRALLCAQHVLRVPHPGGAWCFCLGDQATPCPGQATAPRSLDDVVRQAKERGGFLISGPELLRLVEEHNQR